VEGVFGHGADGGEWDVCMWRNKRERKLTYGVAFLDRLRRGFTGWCCSCRNRRISKRCMVRIQPARTDVKGVVVEGI